MITPFPEDFLTSLNRIMNFSFLFNRTAAFNPQKNAVFSNVIACPSNVCKEDLAALWAMITFHGGSLQAQLDPKVTHLITTKPEGSKYEKCVEIPSIKLVTPDWVVDSVKLKRKCDESGYHPKLLVLPNPQTPKVELSSCTTTYLPHVIESTKPNSITTTTTTCVEVPVPHPATSSAQVTLRTVSLPPSTFITAVPVSDTHNQVPINQQQQARIRVLVPSQNTDATLAQQQNLQPRQVYLHLQAQPPIRQQTSNQVNFIQIRQQQPRAATTEGIQMPVKPIILQQRIQPPGKMNPGNNSLSSNFGVGYRIAIISIMKLTMF